MKILITADSVGGVWQYSTDLARALLPHGIEPILAVLGPSPSAEQRGAAIGMRLIDTGLPLDWIAETPGQVRAAGLAVAELARRERVDLVQLNAPTLAASAEFPVPVIAVAHSCLATWWDAVFGGDLPPDFRWRADLHAEGLRAADVVVTPSAAFAKATAATYGLVHSPLVVHNGRAPLRLPSVPQADYTFTAGRLWDKGKNVATLDRAAATLSVPLDAAGPLEGPSGQSITLEHARPLGSLKEPELARQLAARPIFVSAALYEPFGLAVLEAAAAGCVLVLSDIPTFRELWDGAAIFVHPRDAAGFAAAVEQLIANPGARGEEGAEARARAARYTPEAMASGMADLYSSLVPPRSAAA